MTVAAPTLAQLLDFDGRSQRHETVRFDVLNKANQTVGTLRTVDRKRPPSIVNDGNASVPRRLEGFHLADASEVNPVVDRVRVVWVLGVDGRYELSFGVFLFADAVDLPTSGGTTLDASLSDQTLLLNQVYAQSVSYPAGTNLSYLLAQEAAAGGIVDVSIEFTAAALGAPVIGLAGRDMRLKVMNDACLLAGFFPVYFDNQGTMVCRSVPDLARAQPDHEYGRGAGTTGRVKARSVQKASGLVNAPNRYVVRDTSANEAEIVGIYDVAESAPHSYANTGAYRTRSKDVQGLTDQFGANDAARALYAGDASVFASLTFETPPDPRHDTFGVVRYTDVDAELYVEHVWRLACRAGANMQHDCRRVYV